MATEPEDRVVVTPPGDIAIGLHNRASVLRGWNADNTVAKNIPRFKFSFFVDFSLSNTACVGRFLEDMPSGALQNAIKSIDMPTISYEVDDLPQYNRVRQIIKKQVRKEVTMTLYDDSTSYIRGLLAAYRAHYSFAPLNDNGDPLNVDLPPYFFTNPLGYIGSDTVPSMGMRSVEEPFFWAISIYDLGSEPSSANIYHLIRPTIKDVSSGGLDYTDNEGPREITITIAYEELVEHIGVNWSETNIAVRFPDVYYQGVRITREDRNELTGSPDALSRTGIFRPSTRSIQDDLMEAMRTSIADAAGAAALNRAGVGPGPLLLAIQKSIEGGQINFESLGENVFQALARGTAIQNIRIAYRKALLIKQAIEQGRFLDVIPLVGAGWDQIKDFSWATAGATVDSVVSTIQGSIPGAGTWVESHINGLQLPKIGGAWGG